MKKMRELRPYVSNLWIHRHLMWPVDIIGHFSTGNYSTAGKKGRWPASENISLPYLITLPYLT